MSLEKKITFPDNWGQVNIELFGEIRQAAEKNNSLIDVVAALTKQDPEDVRKWDPSSFNEVAGLTNWVHELPTKESWKNCIDIDGIKYAFINRLSGLTYGLWFDIDTYLNDPVSNLHKLMAVFYRPVISETEKGFIVESYDSESFNIRAELFKEKMNVSDCYGALLFFSTIGKESINGIKEYLYNQLTPIEKMKLYLKERKERKKKQAQGNGVGTI